MAFNAHTGRRFSRASSVPHRSVPDVHVYGIYQHRFRGYCGNAARYGKQRVSGGGSPVPRVYGNVPHQFYRRIRGEHCTVVFPQFEVHVSSAAYSKAICEISDKLYTEFSYTIYSCVCFHVSALELDGGVYHSCGDRNAGYVFNYEAYGVQAYKQKRKNKKMR